MPNDKLTLETDQDGGVISVKVSGFLNVQSISEFRENLRLWDAHGTRQVLLDLSGLKFIDSAGLGVLVQGIQSCRERNIDLKILNVPKHFHNLMREIGLSSLL